jgi:hypothetical protein
MRVLGDRRIYQHHPYCLAFLDDTHLLVGSWAAAFGSSRPEAFVLDWDYLGVWDVVRRERVEAAPIRGVTHAVPGPDGVVLAGLGWVGRWKRGATKPEVLFRPGVYLQGLDVHPDGRIGFVDTYGVVGVWQGGSIAYGPPADAHSAVVAWHGDELLCPSHRLQAWNPTTGRTRTVHPHPPPEARALRMRADPRGVAVQWDRGYVSLHDPASLELVGRFDGKGGRPAGIVATSRGTWLSAWGDRLTELGPDGAIVRDEHNRGGLPAISPDGGRLAVAWHGFVRILDAETWEEPGVRHAVRGTVRAMTVSGDVLAVRAHDGAQGWRGEEVVAELTGGSSTEAGLSGDGAAFVVHATPGRALVRRDVRTGEETGRVELPVWGGRILVSHDGARAATLQIGKDVLYVDFAAGTCRALPTQRQGAAWVGDELWVHEPDRIVAHAPDGTSRGVVALEPDPAGSSLYVSPRGDLAVVSRARQLVAYEIPSGKVRWRTASMGTLAFDPTGERIGGHGERQVITIDAATGQDRRFGWCPYGPTCVAWTGPTTLVAGCDGALVAFDVEELRPKLVREGSPGVPLEERDSGPISAEHLRRILDLQTAWAGERVPEKVVTARRLLEEGQVAAAWKALRPGPDVMIQAIQEQFYDEVEHLRAARALRRAAPPSAPSSAAAPPAFSRFEPPAERAVPVWVAVAIVAVVILGMLLALL